MRKEYLDLSELSVDCAPLGSFPLAATSCCGEMRSRALVI